jgi:Methionyl-tRNA synthetase
MKLTKFENMLKDWIETIDIHSSVKSKLKEWFDVGLRDWDISRDTPYFGFLIPGEEDKYFYVWLDAPIGYFASLKNLSGKSDLQFEEYFKDGSDTHMVHFIGKDIIYFHALFWPAVLEGAGVKKPDAIYVNGFLTVNGEKMSKSRGTFIKARTYLDHLDPEYLRYYFAYKSSAGVDDFDLDTEDFQNRINADLIGKWINIASRSSKFIREHFENTLSADVDKDLMETFDSGANEIKAHYEKREFGQSMRKIMLLADNANQYLDQRKTLG